MQHTLPRWGTARLMAAARWRWVGAGTMDWAAAIQLDPAGREVVELEASGAVGGATSGEDTLPEFIHDRARGSDDEGRLAGAPGVLAAPPWRALGRPRGPDGPPVPRRRRHRLHRDRGRLDRTRGAMAMSGQISLAPSFRIGSGWSRSFSRRFRRSAPRSVSSSVSGARRSNSCAASSPAAALQGDLFRGERAAAWIPGVGDAYRPRPLHDG
jgi:hypothetical protein